MWMVTDLVEIRQTVGVLTQTLVLSPKSVSGSNFTELL